MTSTMKEKIEYQKGRVIAIEEDIKKLGFVIDINSTVNNINIITIKELLIKLKLTTAEEYELKYLEHMEEMLKEIFKNCKEKKKAILVKKLVLPSIQDINNLKVVRS